MESETTWERVDERVLAWVATLPPTLSDHPPFDLPRHPPEEFAHIPGLNTHDVGRSLRRLHDAGFIGGRSDDRDVTWWDVRLARNGLIYFAEWPDLEAVASAVTLHGLLRALATDAPEDERSPLTRAAGVVGRTMSGVLRDALAQVAGAGGAEVAP